MTIPSSRSLILWISVFSITSPSADFGRLRKTSDFFGNLRKWSCRLQKSQHSQDKNLTLISQKKLAGINYAWNKRKHDTAQHSCVRHLGNALDKRDWRWHLTSAFSQRLRKYTFTAVHTKTHKRRFQIYPLWRAFSNLCVYGERFHRLRVDGRPKRIKKFAFTSVCVYNRLRVDGASDLISCRWSSLANQDWCYNPMQLLFSCE